VSGWRFGGADWLWIVEQQPVVNMMYLQIAKNGVVVTNAWTVGVGLWQLGIAENLSTWDSKDAELNVPTIYGRALERIKDAREDEVLEGLLAYLRSIKDRIQAKWLAVSGDTNPDLPGFDSAFEALTTLVNRDRLPPPMEL
jgi:hypothetical protein